MTPLKPFNIYLKPFSIQLIVSKIFQLKLLGDSACISIFCVSFFCGFFIPPCRKRSTSCFLLWSLSVPIFVFQLLLSSLFPIIPYFSVWLVRILYILCSRLVCVFYLPRSISPMSHSWHGRFSLILHFVPCPIIVVQLKLPTNFICAVILSSTGVYLRSSSFLLSLLLRSWFFRTSRCSGVGCSVLSSSYRFFYMMSIYNALAFPYPICCSLHRSWVFQFLFLFSTFCPIISVFGNICLCYIWLFLHYIK